MSKSLKLSAGDLSLNNRELDTVSGRDKLLQDLSLHLREKIGTDPSTPSYGSTLDGGIINEQEVNPFIGQVLTVAVKLSLQKEIYRVLQRYQSEQVIKIKQENLVYGRTTLSPDEVIKSIDSVNITNIGATVIVRITLTSMTNNVVSITTPLLTA